MKTISQPLIERALDLAAEWQQAADRHLTHEEKEQQDLLRRLLSHPGDIVTLAALFDRAFRIGNPARAADLLEHLLEIRGIPESFTTTEKALGILFRSVGRHLPGISVPMMIERMRHYSRRMIIPGEPGHLKKHLEIRRREGAQVNLNHLGEAVLGEMEAGRRLQRYRDYLLDPLVECVSVKISTLFSQIQPLAFEHCVNVLTERLGMLYSDALENQYDHGDGTKTPKLVNLDMEAYSDMALTVESFKRALAREEFKRLTAGIALQAYLPDSHKVQKDLTEWARARVASGGAPIRIRIVKGANLEMEQIEAAVNNWPLAPYDNKSDVDANYKRMMLYGLARENASAVYLGIASHNIFDLALAHEVARANDTLGFMKFEMLEGMADHMCRTLLQSRHPLLLYTPVAEEKEFVNTIAYLIRRLSENTGNHNFLRHYPFLKTASDAWHALGNSFEVACRHLDELSNVSHRTQNRLVEAAAGTSGRIEFTNDPPTDWSLPANHRWAEKIRMNWMKKSGNTPIRITAVVAGREIDSDRSINEIFDPNQLPDRVCVAHYAPVGSEDVRSAVNAARQDPDDWRRMPPEEKREIFFRVAEGLRRGRGDLIGAAAAETGKIFSESDAEVSEAVDFAEYYPFSMRFFEEKDNLRLQGRGVGAVVSPWNFPIAIPCGGLLSALASGNTVILKPASNSVLTAWTLCRIFWAAGISRNTLQFLPGSGSETGMALATDPDIDFMILTGGTETGLQILKHRPDLFLAAETGGKNATIVTASADRDQAVRNVIQSAFSHCGQKCSATSLLILEKEVYEDASFRSTLTDAAASLSVGSAWEFQTKLGPLIRPPEGVLLRGLTRLEPGESWALPPKALGDNPHLWSPGIKWDVRPGSFTHTTELFGPVLGVMRAENLEEAVSLVNRTGYGLTSGIESLDPRELRKWKRGIRAGNLYINRVTTGAVTFRQPFGGLGKSAVGPAVKAGGPDYVTQFMSISDRTPPQMAPIDGDHPLLSLSLRWRAKCRSGRMVPWQEDIEKTVWSIQSYLHWSQQEFVKIRDHFHIRGQDNFFKYIPLKRVLVCVHQRDSLFEILARIAAAKVAGCGVILNLAPGMDDAVIEFLEGQEAELLLDKVDIVRHSPDEIVEIIPEVDRLRYAGPDRVPPEVYTASAGLGRYVARTPVLMDGRIELLHYLATQSICETYHRYGNLGERGMD